MLANLDLVRLPYNHKYYKNDKERYLVRSKIQFEKTIMDPEKRKKRQEYASDYYKKNKQRMNKQALEAIKRMQHIAKILVMSHYSKGENCCSCCGEKTMMLLTVDHPNNDGKEHRKQLKGTNLYCWLVKNKFPKGFRIMCFNCNIGRYRNNGVCPHQKS